MKNNKKKGFTLIELIAVIAILAILGAILVPNVLGYRKKAEKSNIQTSAKTIVSAMEAYNSDKDDAAKLCEGADITDHTKYLAALSKLDSEDLVKTNKVPACLGGSLDGGTASADITYAQVKGVANGDFSIATFNGSKSTINGITAVTL